eukprot:COSAG01_NODE_1356_length_10592_cov_4.971995_11_plen_265_part_00
MWRLISCAPDSVTAVLVPPKGGLSTAADGAAAAEQQQEEEDSAEQEETSSCAWAFGQGCQLSLLGAPHEEGDGAGAAAEAEAEQEQALLKELPTLEARAAEGARYACGGSAEEEGGGSSAAAAAGEMGELRAAAAARGGEAVVMMRGGGALDAAWLEVHRQCLEVLAPLPPDGGGGFAGLFAAVREPAMTPSPSCAEAAAPPRWHSELLRAAPRVASAVLSDSDLRPVCCGHHAGISGSVRGGLRAGVGVPLRGHARGHDGRGV